MEVLQKIISKHRFIGMECGVRRGEMSRVEKYSQGKEVILVAVSPLIKRTLNTLGPA